MKERKKVREFVFCFALLGEIVSEEVGIYKVLEGALKIEEVAFWFCCVVEGWREFDDATR